MGPDDLLCSQNAHDQNVLVRCAQWKINQPPSLKRERASLEGSSLAFAAALPAERCLLARQGWVGEKSGLFEFPVATLGKN